MLNYTILSGQINHTLINEEGHCIWKCQLIYLQYTCSRHIVNVCVRGGGLVDMDVKIHNKLPRGIFPLSSISMRCSATLLIVYSFVSFIHWHPVAVVKVTCVIMTYLWECLGSPWVIIYTSLYGDVNKVQRHFRMNFLEGFFVQFYIRIIQAQIWQHNKSHIYTMSVL